MPVNISTSDLNSPRAIIVFAKQPLNGAVKTRLLPALSEEAATELYARMLQDTLDSVGRLSGITPFIFFEESPEAAAYFKEMAPAIASYEQKGKDLGERMKSAFEAVFAKGFSEIAIIGTDSPDLPLEYIYEAFALLEYEHTDVVFGPAEDGGYYLMAMKRVWDELFTGLPWSSENLLEESLSRAHNHCIGASMTPSWYDIDIPEDLGRSTLLDESCRAVNTREFIVTGCRL